MGGPGPAKDDLRDAVLRMRRPLDPRVLRSASDRAVEHLAGLVAVQRAQVVALHVPGDGDLDPRGLAPVLSERGTRVLLVEASDQRVEVVATGRAQLVRDDGPAQTLDDVDVVVVPGVAFDLEGGRLGPASDPWDGVLDRVPSDAVRIGLATTAQLVPRVPRDDTDRPVDVVVTDRGVHHTGARRHPRDA